MYKPQYLIRLKANVFKQFYAACLGEQLLQILLFIENLIPSHVWYGANIETNFNNEYILNFNSFSLKKIGGISNLKKIAKGTDQFFSGVFIVIKFENLIKEELIQIDTEDPEFRPLDIDRVIIEIRAFDKSYFEIYSEDYDLMQKIANHYNCTIQKPLFKNYSE